jgi:hypothetical protein
MKNKEDILSKMKEQAVKRELVWEVQYSECLEVGSNEK